MGDTAAELPDNSKALVVDAISASKQKIRDKDFEGAQRIISTIYDDMNPLDRVPIEGLKADCFLQQGEPALALECYERILDIQPDPLYWVYVGYANVLERLGKTDKAVEQMCVALEKGYSFELVERVVRLSQFTTSQASALKAVVELSVLHGSSDLVTAVAELLVAEGMFEEAGRLFDAAMEDGESGISVITRMAKAYVNVGESKIAVQKIKDWKSTRPTDQRLDRLLDYCRESRVLFSEQGLPCFMLEDGRSLCDFELRVNGYRVRKGLERYTRILSDAEADEVDLKQYVIVLPQCYVDSNEDDYQLTIEELVGKKREYKSSYPIRKMVANERELCIGDFEFLDNNRIHGWYRSKTDKVNRLALYINGEHLKDLEVDINRADVAAIHGDEYIKCGFDCSWTDDFEVDELELRNTVSGMPVLGTPIKVQRIETAIQELENCLPNLGGESRSKISSDAKRQMFSSLRAMPPITFQYTQNCTQLLRNYEEGVSVIIPVYNGLDDVKRCVSSILKSGNTTAFEVLCVNDCSPNLEVKSYLDKLEKDHDLVTVVHSEINRGFVRTVNKGLAARTYRDVVMLNSDTVVPEKFVDRLSAASRLDRSFGVITPLSNNATIFSFPLTLVENEVSSSDDLSRIDSVLRENSPQSIFEMPTGHGYCMFVSGEVLESVGGFDEEEWGIGYGEENDFCQKVKTNGWKIGAYYGMYVGHVGSVSFGSKKRDAQVKRNQERLVELYPEYERLIQRHIKEENISRIERNRLQIINWKSSGDGRDDILFLSHSLGGGTSEYIERSVDSLSRENTRSIILTTEGNDVVLRDLTNSICCIYRENEIEILKTHLNDLNATEVVVNSACNFPKELFERFKSVVNDYTIVIHDYSWICPRISMIDSTGSYCGMPSSEICVKCVNVSGTHPSFREEWKSVSSSLDVWLTKNKVLMEEARRVIAPSQDAANRIQKRFPTVSPLVVPHSDSFTVDAEIKRHSADSIEEHVIGIFGMIGDHKGLDMLKKLCWIFSAKHSGIRFVFFGALAEYDWMDGYSDVSCIGEYTAEELPGLIAQERPTAALFLSMCPETYCYALTDAIANGVFPIAYDLGAFAERVDMHNYGATIPFELDPDTVYKSIVNVVSGTKFQKASVSDIKSGFSYGSYKTDYLSVEVVSEVLPRRAEA